MELYGGLMERQGTVLGFGGRTRNCMGFLEDKELDGVFLNDKELDGFFRNYKELDGVFRKDKELD